MLITVTGASGSGKSNIAEYLTQLNKNIVHLNIDLVGHEVLESDLVKPLVIKQFNLELIDGKIDRKKLGELVFNSQEKMQELSNLIWEYMQKIIDDFILNTFQFIDSLIIVLDCILIPKSKYYQMSDLNILVNASFDTRMERTMIRDNIEADKFFEREQATLDFSKNEFDYVIYNDDLENTKRLVKSIYDKSIVSG